MNSIPYPAHEQFLDWLADRLADLLRQHPRDEREILFSISLALPGLTLPTVPHLREGDFHWSVPAQNRRLLARGRAWQRQGSGPQRLTELDRQLQGLIPGWRHLDPDGLQPDPLILVAAAFDPLDPMQDTWRDFPNCTLFVPELLLEQDGRDCRLMLCNAADTGDRDCLGRWLKLLDVLLRDLQQTAPAPPRTMAHSVSNPSDRQAWLDLSQRALASIEQGELDKLVLYRQSSLPPPKQGSRALLQELAAAYPDCRLIAMQQGNSEFICASPEQLLVKRGTRVSCDALAGTAPRGIDPADNDHLGRGLQQHAKNRREHGLVSDAVRQVLHPLCRELSAEQPPRVRPLGRLMHLHNRIEGRLNEPVSPLQLAARLHPTPAVCGSPTREALDWLRRQGQSRRGWYSGFAGWISRGGDAELNVLLRCALLRDSGAELFAGAGLVTGSQPLDELAETELKLSAVRDHLRS